jgi:hypothetical protein
MRRVIYIGFWWESQKEKRIVRSRSRRNYNIKNGCQRGWSGINWIDLARDRNLWSAVVKTGFSKILCNSSAAERLAVLK